MDETTAAKRTPLPAGNNEREEKQPERFRLGYRPALDGLRGLAIILVLIAHGLPGVPGSYGFVGVQVFFVLSGFLITHLLLEEYQQTGAVRIGAFYARRALRLLPAIMALLAVFVGYALLTPDSYYRKSFLLEALGVQFYYANWGVIYEWFTAFPLGHAWSLAVEEQFYFLWPLVLLCLVKRFTPSAIIKILIIGAFLSWLERYYLYSGTAATWSRLAYGTDTRGEPLLIGCALAVMLSSGMIPRTAELQAFLAKAAIVSLVGLLVIAAWARLGTPMLIYFGWTALSIFSAVIILDLIIGRRGRLRAAFENPGLVFMGKISYSLYLWHNFVLQVTHEFSWPVWLTASVNVLAITLLCLGSYYLVERPFLRLKHRFQKVR